VTFFFVSKSRYQADVLYCRSYVYRIYTEDVNSDGIEAILDGAFKGYTIFRGEGRWKGKKENSIVIEIEGTTRKRVLAVAKKIKAANKQEAVLVRRDKTDSRLI
jgi:hypothetical protein